MKYFEQINVITNKEETLTLTYKTNAIPSKKIAYVTACHKRAVLWQTYDVKVNLRRLTKLME